MFIVSGGMMDADHGCVKTVPSGMIKPWKRNLLPEFPWLRVWIVSNLEILPAFRSS